MQSPKSLKVGHWLSEIYTLFIVLTIFFGIMPALPWNPPIFSPHKFRWKCWANCLYPISNLDRFLKPPEFLGTSREVFFVKPPFWQGYNSWCFWATSQSHLNCLCQIGINWVHLHQSSGIKIQTFETDHLGKIRHPLNQPNLGGVFSHPIEKYAHVKMGASSSGWKWKIFETTT